jgi:secreted PhoX family phosphatase
VPGTSSNCSGAVTPWGTFLTAEENVNFAYGELESCWNSSNGFVPGPCNAGADIVWNTTPSASADYTRGTAVNTRPHYYSYIAEIDPEAAPGEAYDAETGRGHLKIGSLGRAHWENAAFHVGDDWNLVPDQPIVFYAGDDRRGGRIYKWVSSENYTEGMTKAEIRALLAEGYTYVAHFEDLDNSDDGDTGALGGLTVGGALPSAGTPGVGRWIRLSVDNVTDVAPNAGGGAGSGTTVGDALQDVNWNGMGGFPDDQTVLMGLYSASNKLGIRELNRPEDLEWNPNDGTLWIAFTNHDRLNALRDDGTLNVDDPGTPGNDRDAFARSDDYGAIFVLVEDDAGNPGDSEDFTFYAAWRGSAGATSFEAANPDNLAIDSDGGIWFGTDGNFAADKQDALYFLETAATPEESRAWRIATVPSDAEATGPMFSSDQRTLFFSVQHPAEDLAAAPQSDFAPFGELGPRSGRVSMTLVER